MAYFFTSVDRRRLKVETKRRLDSLPANEVLLAKGRDVDFSTIDHIFADADGTVVMDGATSFTEKKIELLHALHMCGVGVTIVTGKPYTEVLGLRQSLPGSIPLNVLCEKGAYLAQFDDREERSFILSSPAIEKEVAELKKIFFENYAPTLTQKYGVFFGLSGSGAHTSLLGIDYYRHQPPHDYLKLTGDRREDMKITDENLIEKIEQEITIFADKYCPEWNVVYLGGANAEITPDSIDKDKAIEASAHYHVARHIMVLGDSRNDLPMFALSTHNPTRITAGLVAYRKTALSLVDTVDLITFGIANSDPILQSIIDARNK